MNSTEAVQQELLYLREFQRHLSQAAVEKMAVRERARILTELFKAMDRIRYDPGTSVTALGIG